MALNVVFAIYRLEPAGGLEQHCLRLAAELVRRGCRVTIVSTRASTTGPTGVETVGLSARGRTNHGRMAAFLDDATQIASSYDRSVGFHAGGSFDFLFCGDACRRSLWKRPWARLTPRRRGYLALEAKSFARDAGPLILGLSQAQLDSYAAAYRVPRHRLIALPPTIDARRANPSPRPEKRIVSGRTWLWAALAPRTKGLDRALHALKRIPDAGLVVCGCAPEGAQGRRAKTLAARLGVAERVQWLGFVSDAALPGLMATADVLVHPARLDVTGTVILEALANGLPVVTTAVCGYAAHVEQARAGVVLHEPFELRALVEALNGLTPKALHDWSQNALDYAGDPRLYSGVERAADIIEAGGAPSCASSPAAAGGASSRARN